MSVASSETEGRDPGASGRGGSGAIPEGGEWDLGTGRALGAYVFGLLFLMVVGSLFVPLRGAPGGEVSASALVFQGALMLGAGLIPAWILLILAHGARPGSLGFHLHRSALGESVAGILLGIAVTGASVAAMAGVGVVRWVDDGGTVVGLLAQGGTALAILALPAAAEEVIFRGYPLQLLSRSWGPGWALAFTSVGFGLLHGFNPGITPVALLNLVLAGVFLGVVYLKTGSLWWATGAHLGWNWTVGFLVDLPVSGLEMVDTPLWTGVASGPSWLGGGSFGPEGSVLTAVLVLVGTVVIWRARWLSPGAGVREAGVFGKLLDGGSPNDGRDGEEARARDVPGEFRREPGARDESGEES